MTRIGSHHAEWLELLEISGPFLSLPVLERAFPQGLDVLDANDAERVRLAYDEWVDEQQQPRPGPDIHEAWIRFVLQETLDLTDDLLLDGTRVASEFTIEVPEHDANVRPDFVVQGPDGVRGTTTSLLIQSFPPMQDLDGIVADSDWAASPATRMTLMCRAVGVPLGLVTNGERWLLVHAPHGETATFVSWFASLWPQEPLTLRAFQSLLGARRFFGVGRSETLEGLLADSATYQAEVTEQLGAQVRRAVEVLVQAIDRADAESGHRLLSEVSEDGLYEAALVVMMRLVFLFFAEENDLLPLADELYQQSYAASTLRGHLRETADQVGIEVLERRQDAWSRLLATFRAIHGGIEHEALRLPPYGGSLFDPDRFPFLEGRAEGTTWREVEAQPLPIDNRTVLHLLDALQILRMRSTTGLEARKLSFRALDIEQIGHVYETLLDHRVVRASAPVLGLIGSNEPEVSLDELNERLSRGGSDLRDFLEEQTGRGGSALERALAKPVEAEWRERLGVACGDDPSLIERVLPFHALIRSDPWGDPIVIRGGSVYVTAGSERRATGTYYTPRVLTEEMVTHALESLVYDGVADGKPREAWVLKTPSDLLNLKICDPAMGSGAFLVQVVRWLSERLVEAWDIAQEQTGGVIASGGRPAGGRTSELTVPADAEERRALARRLVADRCIYGVDVNPLAVEMAKLSIWLVTLSKGLPFSFLDHALKCGDSLLGVVDIDQIREFHLDPERGSRIHLTLFDPRREIGRIVADAANVRLDLESFTVKDVRDAEEKAALHGRAEHAVDQLRVLGDLVVGAGLVAGSQGTHDLDRRLGRLAGVVSSALEQQGSALDERFRTEAQGMLDAGKPPLKPPRRPFHWPVEFPEVFAREGSGFDGIVSNPPYIGNKYWKERLGADFQPYFASLLGRRLGKPDVIVLFILRIVQLLRPAGTASSLATQSITEVDSKSLMQATVLNYSTIIRAFRARPWPGDASVMVSLLWLVKGQWNGDFVLDDREVAGIDADLREAFGEEPAEVVRGLFAFQGVDNSRGMSLVINADNPLTSHTDLFKPYLSGEDLTQRNPTRRTRFAIDLTGCAERDIGSLPDEVQRFLFEVVRPGRTREQPKSYEGLSRRWWLFWRTREDDFRVVRRDPECIAMPAVAKYLIPLRLPSDWVYTNKVVVFRMSRPDVQTLLLSAAFDVWAKKYGGTLGEGRVMKIAHVVGTFPVPDERADPSLGMAWQEAALAALNRFGPGINDVLNKVHDPTCRDAEIDHLRHLIEEIHAVVAAAYGWEDLVLRFSFEDADEGLRWTLPTETRYELLKRAHDLNHRQALQTSVRE